MPSLEFELTLLLNPYQALVDVEILGIDVALIVSQDDQANRLIADQAKKEKIVDDYMFYDASLKYLLAKIAVFT